MIVNTRQLNNSINSVVVGRAIRHQKDWAALILLDRRYASASIRNKLPKWIGDSVTITPGFGQTVNGLGTFYRLKRETLLNRDFQDDGSTLWS
jgi:chromosome transmission fidelity protein 1